MQADQRMHWGFVLLAGLLCLAWLPGCGTEVREAPVPPGLAGVEQGAEGAARQCKVASGLQHTLALRGDGTVWAWGKNTDGQLGDGSTTARLLPVRVPALSGMAAVSGGGQHSVALKADGTVWTWGINVRAQLGDGTTTQRLLPVQVQGLIVAHGG